MVRNKFSVEKIEKFYDAQILPNFIKDLPKSVDEYHRAVLMEIAMSTLLFTSLTRPSILSSIEKLSYLQWYYNERSIELIEE